MPLLFIALLSLQFSKILALRKLDEDPLKSYDCIHDKLSNPIRLQPNVNTEGPDVANILSEGGDVGDTGSKTPFTTHINTYNLYDEDNTCTFVGQQLSSGLVCNTAIDLLSAESRSKLIDVLEEATTILNDFLLAEPVTIQTIPTSNPIHNVHIPNDSGERAVGGDNHFVLYVASFPLTGNTIGYATAIFTEDNGQPVAGIAAFNTADIALLTREDLVRVAVHEIMHAIGFSSYFFGVEGLVETHVVRDVLRSVFTGTGGIAALKEHLGCPVGSISIVGVDLEDGGGSGTAGSHVDSRILRDEMMAGFMGLTALSNVSLAMLGDLPWFEAVRLENAEGMPYGYLAGCSFATVPCDILTSQRGQETFCFTEGETGCTADFSHIGECDIVHYNTVITNVAYRHFTEANFGGDNPLMDYCPVYEVDSIVGGLSSSCTNLDSSTPDMDERYGMTRGVNSTCLISDLRKTGHTSENNARCFEMQCTPSSVTVNDILEVRVNGSEWRTCTGEGDLLTGFSGYDGGIICPSSAVVCGIISMNQYSYSSSFEPKTPTLGLLCSLVTFLLIYL